MKEWLTRMLGAVGIGVTWAVVWAAAGALLGIVAPSVAMDQLWLGPAIGVFPGFVGGVAFSALLTVAAGGRRLDELSLPNVVAIGGAAGLLVGMLPFIINKPSSEAALWLVAVVVMGSMTVLGAVSAAGSLALARKLSAVTR